VTFVELDFLLIASDYGLSYTLLKKLEVNPNHFQRVVYSLLRKGLIQQVDNNYKKSWIENNKLLLGRSYKLLINSVIHRNKLKVFVPTEKGEKIVEVAKKLKLETELYTKLNKLKEIISERYQQVLEKHKQLQEEQKAKKEELRKQIEEQKQKEFQEK
jgi:hypothetical protein